MYCKYPLAPCPNHTSMEVDLKSMKIIIREANGKKTSMNLEGKALDVFREVFSNDKEFMEKFDLLYSKFLEKFQTDISEYSFSQLVDSYKSLTHK